MKAQIVNANGTINALKWKSKAKTYSLVGTRSTGKGVLDAVERIYCTEDSSYKDYSRRKLSGSEVEVLEFANKFNTQQKKGSKLWM